MKSRIIIVGIIIFIVLGFILQRINSQKILTTSLHSSSNQNINPTATPTPEPIVYDKTTDLKKELETVSPQTQPAGYKEIEDLINSY